MSSTKVFNHRRGPTRRPAGGFDGDRNHFGEVLRVIRQFHGWQLVDLASTIGVSTGTLSQAEHGMRPLPAAALARFETTFGLHPGSLADAEKSEPAWAEKFRLQLKRAIYVATA